MLLDRGGWGDYFELAAFDGLDQSLDQVELGDVEEVHGQRWMGSARMGCAGCEDDALQAGFGLA